MLVTSSPAASTSPPTPLNLYWEIVVVPGFHHERAKGDEPTIHVLLLIIVCLSVGIKPENPYSASCVGREVNLLGVITHGRGTNHVRTKDSGTNHVLVDL